VTDSLLDGAESTVAAEVLARAIGKIGEYDLILLGEGSGDNYSGQVGPRLAELLELPQVGFVNSLQVDGGRLKAARSLEDCLEVVEMELPAVVAVVSEINEARIPAVTQILKAGRKPKWEFSPVELGVNLSGMEPRVRTLSNLASEQERKRLIFSDGIDADVPNLIKALRSEGAAVR